MKFFCMILPCLFTALYSDGMELLEFDQEDSRLSSLTLKEKAFQRRKDSDFNVTQEKFHHILEKEFDLFTLADWGTVKNIIVKITSDHFYHKVYEMGLGGEDSPRRRPPAC